MFSNWCQDFRSVNNSMVSRSEILDEVNTILITLQSIVYKLSMSQSDNKDVSVSQDILPEFHDELWWDNDYVSLSMSVSEDVNNNVECSSVVSDKVLQFVELFPEESSCEDEDLSIADRVKLRKLEQNQSTCASVPEISEQQLATSCDLFVEKMSRCINIISPGYIFNAKKSRRRKKKREAKMIHPELLSLWNNVGDLFGSKSFAPVTKTNVPVVDWNKVNSRHIANVPAPTPQPVHGCSSDPAFYQDRCSRKCQPSGHVTWEVRKSHHADSKTPFGIKYGFLTDAGVITADSNLQIVHGYVWSPSCQQYILHAKFPGELERSEVSNKRRRKKRGLR